MPETLPTHLAIAYRFTNAEGALWHITIPACAVCGQTHKRRHAGGREEEPFFGNHVWVADCDFTEYVLNPIIVVMEPISEKDLPDVLAQYLASRARAGEQ